MAVFQGPEDRDDEQRGGGGVRGGQRGSEPGLGWLVLQYLRRNRGKVMGTFIGLWAGFGIMALGLWWTLFISACVGVGYFIGRRLDESQEDFLEFLDRVLPPGRG